MDFTRDDTKLIKGIAICLMMWYHLFAFPLRIAEENTFIPLFRIGETPLAQTLGNFGGICIALFTVLSGYGIYKLSLRSPAQDRYIWQHICGLYKTAWLIFLLALPLYIHIYATFGKQIPQMFLYNFLCLQSTMNREWWYITPYAILLILFPCIKRFVERKTSCPLSDFFCVLLFNAFRVYILPTLTNSTLMKDLVSTILWDNLSLTIDLLPAFIVGCIFARHDILAKVKHKYGGKPLWVAVSVAAMLAVFFLRFKNFRSYDWLNVAVFILCIDILLNTRFMQFAGRVLIPLGRESTIMWLTHSFLCYYWSFAQRIVYFPKYSPLIFTWFTFLTYTLARAIGFLQGAIERHIYPSDISSPHK